jgi:hypothetical protein
MLNGKATVVSVWHSPCLSIFIFVSNWGSKASNQIPATASSSLVSQDGIINMKNVNCVHLPVRT